MITVRFTSAEAARLRGEALKLGRSLELQRGKVGTKSMIRDGFLLKATKVEDIVTVRIVEAPGRFEGTNQYRNVLDPIVGESTIDGIVGSTSPSRRQMSPLNTDAVAEVPTEETPISIGSTQAFGEALPESPFLLYNSFPTEFDGGVIFVHVYTDAAPPGNADTGFIVTDQPVWLAVLVRWSGLGAVRSVTFSEDYIRGLTGYGFYPRHVVYEDAPVTPIRYGARLPVAHYSSGRLTVAMELEQDGGGVSTIGGAGVFGIHYPNGVAALEWHHVVGPDDIGATLSPDTFSGEAGLFRASGYDLPAVFSWVDGGTPNIVASFRARVRKEVSGSYRLTTARVLIARDTSVSVTVSSVDSVAGADAGLPQVESDKVHIQKYRDDFFLSPASQLVRHSRMRVLVRPALDSSISPAAPTTLELHTDLALLITTASSTVVQTQAVLGYGPEEATAGSLVSSGTNGIENAGFSTPVGVGEVWSWGFINGTSATQIGIARITASGVAAPLASGLPRTLRLGTYQKEVLNEDDQVVVPMGQVATVLDAGEPKIAIKKGRFGALDFIPAASYSRLGTYYLASALSSPSYGRMYG